MRKQIVMAFIGLVTFVAPALAQSPYGYVGSNNSAPFLGYVGGGGGPYIPNYGTFVIGLAPRPAPIINKTNVVVYQQIQAEQPQRNRRPRCGPVLLTVPSGERFEPFSACPTGGLTPQSLHRSSGPKIIRIE